jgi:Arc/MetJ-type ribon-helix-helix transcriptional regulator
MDERTVTLAEADAELATRLVAEGRYASADEVVQAAMDALRGVVEFDRTMDWASIRAAAAEGEAALARGDYVELNSDAELEAHLDSIMAKLEADAGTAP